MGEAQTLRQNNAEMSSPPVDFDPQGRIEALLRILHKTVRTHQLYKGSGEILARFNGELREQFEILWTSFPEFTLQIEEHEMLWEERSVYHSADRSDNLAFVFFRDGLRTLTFQPGFEVEAAGPFVSLLARLHRLRGEEDDLLTLLWEMDLSHFRYTYVDTLAEGADPAQGARARTSPLSMDAVREDAQHQAMATQVSMNDFQEALYFLEDAELRVLAAEIEGEDRRDLWGGVLSALFDRLEDGSPNRQEEIMEIVRELLPTLLAGANHAKAAVLLRELTASASAPATPPVVRTAARKVMDELVSPESIDQLLQSAEAMPGAGDDPGFAAFLGLLPARALGALLRGEAFTPRPEFRRAIGDAVGRLAAAHPDEVVHLLGEEDPALATAAARWVGKLRLSHAAAPLSRLLGAPQAEVRTAAILALQEIRNSSAATALVRCLEDDEREVRIAAARALGDLRFSPAREPLEALIKEGRSDVDVTERIAVFEAYGSLAGAAGVGVLNRLLNGKSWLGRRADPEVRAAAALGLGRIGLPAGDKALRAAAADSEAVVRSAVGRALRRGLA